MKVIITGATGMVGKGVLLECLDHPEIELVLTLGRHPVDVTHPKLNQITVNDFGNFQSIVKDLGEYDACFYCMGVSAGGLDETAYTRLTYDYTMALAELLYSLHRDMTFIYVSGEGTDASEKGRMMWARVKGKTENDLMKLGFKQVFAFRPGIIIPLRGIKSRTKSYQFMYDYFMWLVKIIKAITPKSVVNTTQIGKAMINASLYGYDKAIIRPGDIITLSEMNS